MSVSSTKLHSGNLNFLKGHLFCTQPADAGGEGERKKNKENSRVKFNIT